jgi:hypothetical protein
MHRRPLTSRWRISRGILTLVIELPKRQRDYSHTGTTLPFIGVTGIGLTGIININLLFMIYSAVHSVKREKVLEKEKEKASILEVGQWPQVRSVTFLLNVYEITPSVQL